MTPLTVSLRRLPWARTIRAALAAFVIALMSGPLFAQTYSVKVTPRLHDLDVKIEYVDSTSVLVMKLTNRTQKRVRCQL
ncbi:MAG TPA: hypothetical protein VMT50_07085, partial [Steroidobacteraceae bacterium]|nr:hypothetical protein [Steroidobacteraceae bacterium]